MLYLICGTLPYNLPYKTTGLPGHTTDPNLNNTHIYEYGGYDNNHTQHARSGQCQSRGS